VIRNVYLISVLAALALAGCKHKCCLNDPCNRPKPYQPPPPNGSILLPPAAVPTTPNGPAPAGAFVPPVGPSDMRNYTPPPSLGPAPSGPSFKPTPEVLYPDPLPAGPSSRSSSSNNSGNGARTPLAPAAPVVPESAAATGLPGFRKVKEGLASGRRPDLDGFATLRQRGYRTVIYLHAPGADVPAVQQVAEKQGLEFVAIQTTPENLPRALDAFNQAVANKAVRPAYVFSDDGIRSGAMWYLHFRSVDALNDDTARVLAKPLGLTDQSSEGQVFELAIQHYLETH
jgi:protein tyrosine phosphatase (PTP) superfamily phosphohydrolase (DUF442 family)